MLHDRFIVNGGSNERPVVCISFDCENSDDMRRIPSLLEMLKDNDITTSFAIRGDLLEQHEDVVRELLRKGHEIINHTFAHPPKFAFVGAERMRQEVESFQVLMKRRFGCTPEGFRAPHLMRRYNEVLFRILRENKLYDSSYVGSGVSLIDGVAEIPLTACPDHPQVCYDYWHHFQLPFIRCSLKKFLQLWEHLLIKRQLINVFLDPRCVSDAFLLEMVGRVPDGYTFHRLGDIAEPMGRGAGGKQV
jgi:hypothetical protein